ncbi:hypothetical protein BJV82DRAFT_675956 [Fennellomyces sp. T-0311]|nr:hypothetical protein BJV82DRAFT_675956 [Fennellomyces sp. T-0311]
MSSVASLYQELSNSQQQTDLIASLRGLIERFKPVNLEDLSFPKHITTKGRPKGIKGTRLPSAFENAEHEEKQKEKARKEAAKKDEDQQGDNALKFSKKSKVPTEDDHDDLWPQKKSYRKKALTSVPSWVHEQVPRHAICAVITVHSDGWCGWRALAAQYEKCKFDENRFIEVKERMLSTARANAAIYLKYVCMASEREYQYLLETLEYGVALKTAHLRTKSCPLKYWFDANTMAQIAADALETPIAVFITGTASEHTPTLYLPLSPPPTGAKPQPFVLHLVVGRSKQYMEGLYKKAKGFNKTAALKYGQKHSFHIVKNAFWSVPFFDIYQALTVDDLHQLGGMYTNLLELIEKMLKDGNDQGIIKQVTKRASMIPPFSKLRPFKSGFFPSDLKNPTYTELRSHMAIVMSCVHDILPSQLVQCLRHFIDFEYNKYSAFLASVNPMTYPKNHMMWKYMFDIQQKGCVHSYSTTHSECQHKSDAKEAARRTNYARDTFVPQMANYIMYRDLLFDTYQYASAETVKANMGRKTTYTHDAATASTAPEPKITLSSPFLTSDPISFEELATKRTDLKPMYNLTCIYLSTVKDEERRVRLKDMPKPKDDKLCAYQTLKIEDIDDRGTVYSEFIRANPSFYRRTRYDFVQTKDKHFVQILLFFTINREFKMEYNDPASDLVEEQLCLVRVFNKIDKIHASGFQVLEYPTMIDSPLRHEGLCVMSIKSIDHLMHVVPDFATAVNHVEEEDGMYNNYLVNYCGEPLHVWTQWRSVKHPF